jgi:hypothetical protein
MGTDQRASSTKVRITTYLLIELSPSWGAANCAATEELARILCNPKVHYRVHKSLLLAPMLRHINPIHTIPSCLSKIYFNIVTHLRLGLPSGLILSSFPTNILYAFLFSPFALQGPPISSFLTWLFYLYLEKSTGYEALLEVTMNYFQYAALQFRS